MDASELTIYRVAAGLLAFITLMGWLWFVDTWSIAYHAYFALVGAALTVASFSQIDAYRSGRHRVLGSFYLAASGSAVAAALLEVALTGYDSGSFGFKVLQAGLLALLARGALLGDVKADV